MVTYSGLKHITLGHRTVELTNLKGEDFLSKLKKYLKYAAHNTSPGNPEFASGEVFLDSNSFVLNPGGMEYWNHLFSFITYGTIGINGSGKHVITLTFKSSTFKLLLACSTFLFVPIFFHKWPLFGKILLEIFLALMFILNIFFERWLYKRECRKQVEFILGIEKMEAIPD
ncbi:hypothetical protein [Fulvivirga sp.]|uniref:hypothetical protein n=1 Tax=Fulvivirga sp. TaxID=1931237 RepID=UPI0032F0593A